MNIKEKMKIAIIGATGKAGSLMTKKAVQAGFDVTAVVRNASNLTVPVNQILEKDVFDLAASDLTGFDVIISAFRAPKNQEEQYAELFAHLTKIMDGNPARLLIMGGAGSLYADETHTKKHWETMPQDAPWIATPREMTKASEIIKSSDLMWTYFSPADSLEENAPETRNYTITDNVLRLNAKGESKISYADYAQAMIDLIKTGEHQREHIGIHGN